MSCPALENWLAALDEDTGAPAGAHPDCATCAATEQQASALLAAVRDAAPRSPRSDEAFVSAVLGARAPARPARRRVHRLVWAAAPFAAAAIVILALYVRRPVPEDSPVARGTTGMTPWCEVALVKDGGLQFLADGDHVSAGSSLAFRVRHEGPRDAFLGIMAITERGQVAWYSPAFESADDAPQTVRLRPSREAQLLPERVSLPLGEGKVEVLCWKAERAWSVRQADALVEHAVAAAREDPSTIARVPALEGDQMGVHLWFEPAR